MSANLPTKQPVVKKAVAAKKPTVTKTTAAPATTTADSKKVATKPTVTPSTTTTAPKAATKTTAPKPTVTTSQKATVTAPKKTAVKTVTTATKPATKTTPTTAPKVDTVAAKKPVVTKSSTVTSTNAQKGSILTSEFNLFDAEPSLLVTKTVRSIQPKKSTVQVYEIDPNVGPVDYPSIATIYGEGIDPSLVKVKFGTLPSVFLEVTVTFFFSFPILLLFYFWVIST